MKLNINRKCNEFLLRPDDPKLKRIFWDFRLDDMADTMIYFFIFSLVLFLLEMYAVLFLTETE